MVPLDRFDFPESNPGQFEYIERYEKDWLQGPRSSLSAATVARRTTNLQTLDSWLRNNPEFRAKLRKVWKKVSSEGPVFYLDDEALADFFQDLRTRGYSRNTRVAYRGDLADFLEYARDSRLLRNAPRLQDIDVES